MMESDIRKGVVALAFGSPFSLPSNEAIRDTAHAAAWALDAPIFTQWDCGIMERDSPVAVIHCPETPGKPPPLLRICRAAASWAAARCLDEIYVVSAPPQMRLCLRDMRESFSELGSGIRTHSWGEDILRDSHSPDFWFPSSSFKWQWNLADRCFKIMPWRMYSLLMG